MCMNADGAAAVEALRAELARVKERARFSDAAAERASTELKAEQAARCQGEEKLSTMARELKSAASRCELLEKENEAKMAKIDKALREGEKRGLNPERPVRRSGKLGILQLASPFSAD